VLSISGTAVDPDGVRGLVAYFDDQQDPVLQVAGSSTSANAKAFGPLTVSTVSLIEGPHELHLVAYDDNPEVTVPHAIHIPFFVDRSATPSGCAADGASPTVTITSPGGGATLQLGNVIMTATASDDRGIEKVEFLVDGGVVAVDHEAPFRKTWAASLGSHTLRARAYDGCKPPVESSAVTINVQVADPCDGDTTGPSVVISYPQSGSTFASGTAIAFVATTSDANGIDHVNFFFSGELGSSDDMAPFQAERWYTSPGSYQMHARAFDECGNRTISTPIVVHISGPIEPCDFDSSPPSGTLSFPSPGSSVLHGYLTLTATAQDDVAVSEVAFEMDGNIPADATDGLFPYEYRWSSGVGDHTVRARIVDECDKIAWSTPVTFTVTNRNPVAVFDDVSTRRNQAVTIESISNDYDPDGDALILASNTFPLLPTHGTVTAVDGNAIRYTPSSGFVGNDWFKYRVSDGYGGHDVTNVTIHVNP
jgi:hypothetical protein